ncbi:hypothetical protein [Lentzea guizhouensis]|nr:hypothetical protein [Lentzea guizhouensis]
MRGVKPVRRYTAAETLQAVARMMTASRPGGIGLAAVDEVSGCTGTGVPHVKLSYLADLHALRRWADALQSVSKVELYKGFGEPASVHVMVTGRIPRGPVIAVSAWVSGLTPPAAWEQQGGEQRQVLTLTELHTLDDAHRTGGGR